MKQLALSYTCISDGCRIFSISDLIKRKKVKVADRKVDVYAVTKDNGFVKSDSIHDFAVYSSDISNYSIVKKDYIAYNPSRLNIGSLALFKDEIGAVSPMYVVFECKTDLVIPKFLFYFLKSNSIMYKIDCLKEEGARFKFNFEKWKKINIILPPLKQQQHIVHILGYYTFLIDTLKEELSLRQKQFEYYREKLLAFDDESILKPLGHVGSFTRGNGLTKSEFVDKGIGCIHYGQIYTSIGFSMSKTLTYVSERTADPLVKVRTGNLVIACTSENVEDVCKAVVWEGLDNIVTGGHACVFRHSENPRYIGYCLQTNNFYQQKKKYVYGAKVFDIKTEKLSKILIPVPGLATQQSIVSYLDNFESLISNIQEEIALRTKQYEYYRDSLLSFE